MIVESTPSEGENTTADNTSAHNSEKVQNEAVCDVFCTDSDDDVELDTGSKEGEYGTESVDQSETQENGSDDEYFAQTEVDGSRVGFFHKSTNNLLTESQKQRSKSTRVSQDIGAINHSSRRIQNENNSGADEAVLAQ